MRQKIKADINLIEKVSGKRINFQIIKGGVASYLKDIIAWFTIGSTSEEDNNIFKLPEVAGN
jgi:hypothetical protein